MKRKPNPNGIKYWALCDSGKYILKLEIYQGKSSRIQEMNFNEYGLGGYVVLEMINFFLKGPFIIIFDSFFSSLELAQKLKEKGLFFICTARYPKLAISRWYS